MHVVSEAVVAMKDGVRDDLVQRFIRTDDFFTSAGFRISTKSTHPGRSSAVRNV